MDELLVRRGDGVERVRLSPMLDRVGAVDGDGRKAPAAHSRFEEAADCDFSTRVEMENGAETRHALRSQCAIDQKVQDLPFRGGLRPTIPAEMPLRQLVSFEHA